MSTSENGVYGIEKITANSENKNCVSVIYKGLKKLIQQKNKQNKEIVIVCIGTDRATGDAFGPLVGTMLSKSNVIKKNFAIYGTLEKPVHALNLKETISKIKEKHNNSFIIAIDASVGEEKNIGNIKIANGSLTPGAGVGKDLPTIGDISISGVGTLENSSDQMSILRSTRLWYSYNMAVKTEKALYKVLNEQYKNKNLDLRRVSNG